MEPKIYSLQEHNIPHKQIDKHAYYVIEKLKSQGYTAYLVGGSVRDLLLGAKPKDFDISTSARPEEIRRLFKNCILIGRRFRLAHIRFGKKILEVSTFRAGDPDSTDLILRDNVWGSPEEDVHRRDFTINGLFYDPETQDLIDYVGGFEDAKKKLLRVIGIPHVRFMQDPVRMIRLLKFQARFGFNVDPLACKALYECKLELLKSSQARILEELLRMMESGSSFDFFRLLTDYGFLHILLPKLSKYTEAQKDNLVYQLLEQIDIYLRKNPPEPLERSILLSALTYPLLEQEISKYIQTHQHLHLGVISQSANELLTDLFEPFFRLPRKLKADVVTILLNQFRLLPPDKNLPQKIRIPKDPLFSLAMKFFNLRCHLEPDLFKVYTLWNEHLINAHKRAKKSQDYVPNKRRKK